MTHVERKRQGEQTNYLLDGRTLVNGDGLELRLRGNQGWKGVEVEGLPQQLRVRWEADNGQTLHASVPDDAELRWP